MAKPTNIPAPKIPSASSTKKPSRPWFVRIGFMNAFMLLLNFAFTLLCLVWVIGENSRDSWGGFAFFGACFTFLAYGEWRKFQPQPKDRVEFNDWGITRTMTAGKQEKIAWRDIDRIRIFTTDDGPYAPDMFWTFERADLRTGCLVNNDSEGLNALLRHIQTFANFDNMQIIEASGCTQNAAFTVWTRPD